MINVPIEPGNYEGHREGDLELGIFLAFRLLDDCGCGVRSIVHFQWIVHSLASPLRDREAFKPRSIAETRRQI